MTAVYRVKSGDTLSKLANSFGISLNELRALNPGIENPSLIFVGQLLNVPGESEPERPAPTPPTTSRNDGRPAWYEIAFQEMVDGVEEIAGSQHNPRIIEYHQATSLSASNDETPWCSSFVNWCMREAGVERTDSAAARSWLSWGRELSEPRLGCVTVFSRGSNPAQGHVAFFKELDGPNVLVLGGNQSNQVNISPYKAARLLSYRWPASG